jgi:uncharacterized protein (TIGR00369 family)
VKIDPSHLKEVFEHMVPFNRFLGLQVVKVESGKAELRLPFRDEFVGDSRRPALHGGVISALIDTCGGLAAWTRLEEDDRLSTIDILVDYLKPAFTGLVAYGELVRIGNRVAVVRVTVLQDGDEEPVARGRAVYNIARKAKRESS